MRAHANDLENQIREGKARKAKEAADNAAADLLLDKRLGLDWQNQPQAPKRTIGGAAPPREAAVQARVAQPPHDRVQRLERVGLPLGPQLLLEGFRFHSADAASRDDACAPAWHPRAPGSASKSDRTRPAPRSSY